MLYLTLFREGLFGVTYRWGKVNLTCHTYPTMMKHGTVIPSVKKIYKIWESRDTYLEVCWHFMQMSKFFYIKKYRYRLHFDT